MLKSVFAGDRFFVDLYLHGLQQGNDSHAVEANPYSMVADVLESVKGLCSLAG